MIYSYKFKTVHIETINKKKKNTTKLVPLEKLPYRFDNHFVHLHVWRRGQSEQNRLRYILRFQHCLAHHSSHMIWHDLCVHHAGADALYKLKAKNGLTDYREEVTHLP